MSDLYCLAIPFIIDRFRFFRKLLWVYAGVGIVALLLVLVNSAKVHGAHITYSIKGFTFQPSEIVKILFLFFIAALLYKYNDFKWIIVSAILSGCFVIILVLSRDLGSALIFFVAYFMILVMSTHNYWYLLTGIVGGALASIVAYNLFDHVKVRVVAFLDPWTYIDDQAYQITQSLFFFFS